jgi:hypothetical protein
MKVSKKNQKKQFILCFKASLTKRKAWARARYASLMHKRPSDNLDNSLKLGVTSFEKDVVLGAVREHMNCYVLSSHQKAKLQFLLLNKEQNISEVSFLKKILNFFQDHRSFVVSHVMTCLVSVFVTLGSVYILNNFSFKDVPDPLSEVASFSDNLKFPADFNLDGNLNDLNDLIHDSFPSHSFAPSIPSNIAKDYSAYEGRFFLYKGEQGVGIQMKPSRNLVEDLPVRLQQGFQNNSGSMLYIVKLSEKNRATFPIHKTAHKIVSPSGKTQKILTWREGFYGFAIIQP